MKKDVNWGLVNTILFGAGLLLSVGQMFVGNKCTEQAINQACEEAITRKLGSGN